MSSYAIVIGVNHYAPIDDSGLKPLSGAIADAEAIADWLLNNGGIAQENLFLLTSIEKRDRVLRNHVEDAVAQITKRIVQEEGSDANRLYFYFAGHGLSNEMDAEDNGLIMSDWNHFLVNSSALSSSDYRRKFLTEGFFKEIVIWLDCCRTKKIKLNPTPSSGIYYRGKNKSPKFFVGFATTYDNAAFEATSTEDQDHEYRGIFTRELLRGLNGGAIDEKGRVDSESLTNYLYERVPIAAKEAGFSQEPEISKNTAVTRNIFFT
ncbi:MAG: caspase family protein [Sphingobacterium sp.]